MSKALCLILVCALLVFSCAVCPAQHLTGHRTYPFNSDVVDQLLGELERGPVTRVPQTFFGKNYGYDKNLVDLIVYFKDRNSPVAQRLVRNGRTLQDTWGARTVWVMVFTTDPALVALDADTTTTYEQTIVSKNAKAPAITTAADCTSAS